MKEIEDQTNKWKDIPCSQIGRTNIITFPIKSAFYRLNAIPIKIHPVKLQIKNYGREGGRKEGRKEGWNSIFDRTRINIPKICMEPQLKICMNF